ncbi:MAG: hypothetical protein QOG80_2950 [Pseudonocardiales bacterium]|nr:hypothetical protein [Pseudonocardiales bacterium]
MTVAFLILSGVAALGDWAAVARRQRSIEIVLKPATLVLLIVAAALGNLGEAKPWVLTALAFGVIGDVALLFSSDAPPEPGAPAEAELDPAFLAGLAAFLLGHLAYVVAFARHGLHGWQAAAGALVVGGAIVLAMPRVIRGARDTGGRALAAIVGGYAAVLATMVVLAFSTAAIATAIGAAVFLASDTTLAWNRFVQPLLRGPVIVIVTYHVAQILIVIGLLH